jgi:CBS domain-containing protein
MLAHSFSYLPVFIQNKWHLLSDGNIAKYIESNRKQLLAQSVHEAVADGLCIESVDSCNPSTSSSEVIEKFSGKPLLVIDAMHERKLLGIVTAFDLL